MQPGTECIIEGLTNQLLAKPFRPLRLAKITKGEKKYYYQISRQTHQSDVECLLSKSIELHYISDPCTFSSLVLTCFMTNFYSCNPASIIVELDFDESQTITSVRYKGIEGFTFKSVARPNTKKQSNTRAKNGSEVIHSPLLHLPSQEELGRNILFLFPQMDDSIPPEFIENLLAISPELMIINWLHF